MAPTEQANDPSGGKKAKSRIPLLLGVLGLLVLAGFFSNYYISQHQSLFIVSGLESPVTLEIPGVLSIEIPAAGLRQVEIPEGNYQATVQGATNQTIAFSLGVPYWKRWTAQHAFIINVGGSALVLEETTYYASEPGAESSIGQGDHQLYYGKPFLVISNVDYLFQEFPDQLTGDTRQGRVAKRRVAMVEMTPKQLFYALVNGQEFEEGLDLAEWYLRSHPQETELLPTYLGAARLADQEQRASDFLSQGAKRLSTNIQWHRMYQETRHADPADLVAEYDRLLKTDPDNSVWLYLRGRLSVTCEDSAAYYVKAIQSDPENAFAQFALGMVLSSQKRWEEARVPLVAATKLNADNPQFQDALFDARMALQEYESLREDLFERLRESPLHYQDNIRLADVYAAQGQDEALRDLLIHFAQEMHARFQKSGMEAVVNLDARVAYSIGHFSEIEELAKSLGEGFPKFTLFHALIEQAKFEEAFALFPLDDAKMEEPLHYLTVSVALSLAERTEEAQAWMNRALELLREDRPEYKVVGRLLAGTTAPRPDEVFALVLTPSAKAQICAAFGMKFPELREIMFQEAKDVNVSRDYPFHLINRVVKSAAPPAGD